MSQKVTLFSIILLCAVICQFQAAQDNEVDGSKYTYDSILYDFDGDCTIAKQYVAKDKDFTDFCLPYKNLSFKDIWADQSKKSSKKTMDDKINNLNLYIKQHPQIFKKKIEVRESRLRPGQLGVFALEKIDYNASFAKFQPSDIYSTLLNIDGFKDQPYYVEQKELVESYLSQEPNSNFHKSLFNFLYHVYHFEDSPFKADILALSPIPETPLVTLNGYELVLLMNLDLSYKYTIGMRKRIIKEHEFMAKKLEETWDLETRQKVLNGRSTISLDDYTYAYALFYQHSYTDPRHVDNYVTVLLPVLQYIQKYRDPSEQYDEQSVFYNDQKNMVQVKANHFFEPDDEITIHQYRQKNYKTFIIQGYFYEKNWDECLNLQFFPNSTTAKKFNLEEYNCVHKDSPVLHQIYLTTNFLNMSPEEQEQCKEKYEEYEKDWIQMSQIMFEQCPHPIWDKLDLFKPSLKALQEHQQQLTTINKGLEEYAFLRVKDHHSMENAELIRLYLNEHTKIVGELLEKLNELKSISGDIEAAKKRRAKDQKKMEKRNQKMTKMAQQRRMKDLEANNDKEEL